MTVTPGEPSPLIVVGVGGQAVQDAQAPEGLNDAAGGALPHPQGGP